MLQIAKVTANTFIKRQIEQFANYKSVDENL